MTRKRRLRGFESTRLGRELAADGIRVARLALPRSALFNRSNAGPLQLVKIRPLQLVKIRPLQLVKLRPSSTGQNQALFNRSNAGLLQLVKLRPASTFQTQAL